jgi:hypothetical protein
MSGRPYLSKYPEAAGTDFVLHVIVDAFNVAKRKSPDVVYVIY